MRTILAYLGRKVRNAHIVTVDRSASSHGETITARIDRTHLARVLLARASYLANIEETPAHVE